MRLYPGTTHHKGYYTGEPEQLEFEFDKGPEEWYTRYTFDTKSGRFRPIIEEQQLEKEAEDPEQPDVFLSSDELAEICGSVFPESTSMSPRGEWQRIVNTLELKSFTIIQKEKQK